MFVFVGDDHDGDGDDDDVFCGDHFPIHLNLNLNFWKHSPMMGFHA